MIFPKPSAVEGRDSAEASGQREAPVQVSGRGGLSRRDEYEGPAWQRGVRRALRLRGGKNNLTAGRTHTFSVMPGVEQAPGLEQLLS